jgi:hypothetical protein
MKNLRVSFLSPCREDWDEMTPEGRNRFCGQCAKTIHDLSQHSFEEAQVLLQSCDEICVRARLGTNGEIELRSGPARKARRIIAAFGVSVSLMATSASATAGKRGPEGTIAGRVDYSWPTILVTATSENGKKHIAKTNRNGRYKIKHLPPGTYQIAFSDGDTTHWTGDDAIVEDRKTAVRDTENPNPPIVVGLIQVDNTSG